MKIILNSIFLIFLILYPSSTFYFSQSSNTILTVEVKGTITNLTVENIAEAFANAERNAGAIILLINTPGGILESTFRIIELIEQSNVPIIGFVYPTGSRAWSAGAFILMSTHIAVMAPNTIIGSAQPVAFDPISGGSTPINDPKTVNALAKYMQTKAEMHNRNGLVASKFVAENLNLNDAEALDANIIDFRAETIEELTRKLDGKLVKVGEKTLILETNDASFIEWKPSLRTSLLEIISDPIIAYLLFIIGFFGLIFGLSSPGLGTELIGGILLILGLTGIGVLGVDISGILFLILGFLLLLAEIFIPGFGIIGIAGLACAIIGGFLVFPREWNIDPIFLRNLSIVLIIIPLIMAGFFLFALYKILKIRRKEPLHKGLVGEEAVAYGDIA
ncbi:nodulation protein NfeD, partial [Candidatus Bathyarchaeota archaeon]|nr:nodulation protein NfeD [Candidatus Bathyarchaeota archaeon]